MSVLRSIRVVPVTLLLASDRPGFDELTMADYFTDQARRHRAKVWR